MRQDHVLLGRPTSLLRLPSAVPKTCCRSCPRCSDCPVLVAAAARRREREDQVAALIDEVFCGAVSVRKLPEPVARTLEALEQARRGGTPAFI
jgi:hypothetical protein